jgi:hypothetical protein
MLEPSLKFSEPKAWAHRVHAFFSERPEMRFETERSRR